MHIEGPHTPEEAARFRAALERNATLLQVLGRAATMNLPGWYLAAGSLTQSVWNMVTGHPPEYGIDDYDIVCKCLSFFSLGLWPRLVGSEKLVTPHTKR